MSAYWRDDPADVSLNAICGLAGVSKPALYREFGGEDGLMRAVLDRYAAKVLSDIFGIISHDTPLDDALGALKHFASADPRMETGCVFFKMRAGRHRLGPKTRELVDAIDAGAVTAFAGYLEARRKASDWQGDLNVSTAARYILEQIGLALTRRASGDDPAQISDMLALAFSAIRRL